MNELKKHFNNEAENFDEKIRKNIPRYDEMLEALINAIATDKTNPKILDLGCGTGNITSKVLEKFPEAKVTCLDLSENMIKIARQKLDNYDNIEYIVDDFTKLDIKEGYDAIISSLALHHIESDSNKLEMYKCIYDALVSGGVFYNADVIKAGSEYNKKLNEEVSRQYMIDNGVSPEEIESHKSKRDANDIPITMTSHIKLLEEAGFTEIDVIWKYYSNAVYGGTKK